MIIIVYLIYNIQIDIRQWIGILTVIESLLYTRCFIYFISLVFIVALCGNCYYVNFIWWGNWCLERENAWVFQGYITNKCQNLNMDFSVSIGRHNIHCTRCPPCRTSDSSDPHDYRAVLPSMVAMSHVHLFKFKLAELNSIKNSVPQLCVLSSQ